MIHNTISAIAWRPNSKINEMPFHRLDINNKVNLWINKLFDHLKIY